MHAARLLRVLTLGVLATVIAAPAPAQSEKREDTTGYNAIIDNIDLLVDTYARTLARKYDLTEEQDEYTKFLLRERAYGFLDQHEGNLRGLIDRLFDVRTGGEMTQEELIEWGESFKPLYDEARKLITDGNEEWREILTPEQQKIHDEDLKLMYQSFETTEEQLERIISGEMTVDEFRAPQRGGRRAARPRTNRPVAPGEPEPPPPPEEPDVVRKGPPPRPPDRPGQTPRGDKPSARLADRAGEQADARINRPEPGKANPRAPKRPERPARPTRDLKRDPSGGKPETAQKSSEEFESTWEKYVREFIAKYKLNDEQTQKANAVLEDCETQAKRYMIGRREQMERLDRQIEELRKSNDKQKASGVAELNEKRKKLVEPIEQIFEQQLKPRLERLPTRAQRRAAEAASAKESAKKGKSPRKTPTKPAEPKDD